MHAWTRFHRLAPRKPGRPAGGGGLVPPNGEALRLLADFRNEYARILGSTRDTGTLVREVRLRLDRLPADVAADARLWLIMEHGLDVDRWERRLRERGEGKP